MKRRIQERFDFSKRVPDNVDLAPDLMARIEAIRPVDRVLKQEELDHAAQDIQLMDWRIVDLSVKPERDEIGRIKAFLGRRESYRVDCPITLYWTIERIERNRLIMKSRLLFESNSGDSRAYSYLEHYIREALGIGSMRMIDLMNDEILFIPKAPLSDTYCLLTDVIRDMEGYLASLKALMGK